MDEKEKEVRDSIYEKLVEDAEKNVNPTYPAIHKVMGLGTEADVRIVEFNRQLEAEVHAQIETAEEGGESEAETENGSGSEEED